MPPPPLLSFLANGLSQEAVTWIAVAMNVGNVVVVLLSTVLMDRAGRRVLLLCSMAGMVRSHPPHLYSHPPHL